MKKSIKRAKRNMKNAGKRQPGPAATVIVRRSRIPLYVGDGVERLRQLERRCNRLEEVTRFYASAGVDNFDRGLRAKAALKEREA